MSLASEPESFGCAEAAFRREHPLYADTAALDELRLTDFARLEHGRHVYLDYTGGGLYADSQLVEHMQLLRENVFGNPHSINPTSALSTELLERVRVRVLEFFRAPPEEYDVLRDQRRGVRAAPGRR
jgi:molybdenum cofactor sulfurtransferase